MLALTHDRADRAGWFVAMALVISVANGLGAGILMTLGADLADPGDPARFLGAWRFTTDLGGAALPLLVTAISAVAGLSVGVAAAGVVGYAGAAILRVVVPRHVSRRPGGGRPTLEA